MANKLVKHLVPLMLAFTFSLTTLAAENKDKDQPVTLDGEVVNVQGTVNAVLDEPIAVTGAVVASLQEPVEVTASAPIEVIPPDESMAVSDYCADARTLAYLSANQDPPETIFLELEDCRYLHSVTASVTAPEGIVGLYNLYLGHWDVATSSFVNAMQLGTANFIGNGTRDVIEFNAPFPIDLTELPPFAMVYATLTEIGSAPIAIRYDLSYVATDSLP
jgi:hypothetical protein